MNYYPLQPVLNAEGYKQIAIEASVTTPLAPNISAAGALIANTSATDRIYYIVTGEDFSATDIGIPILPGETVFLPNKEHLTNIRFTASSRSNLTCQFYI
jgi:hypothetical protein|tara:strand:+ start:7435 stop:7734 length:300 start_codon:yes stop_codon:yes gene_type:complete